MGRKYVYTASSASSDSDSDSSTPPPRQYRLRQHRSHKRTSSPPAPQLTGPSLQSSTNGNSNEDKKKKKKKKPKKPPQESIDQIWDKFSQKKFSKALSVLPFAPVPASASGERGNELLSAGFERAAEECRRKVRKIITECKRVNTRYRDPGWDLVSVQTESILILGSRFGQICSRRCLKANNSVGLGLQVGEGTLPKQPGQDQISHLPRELDQSLVEYTQSRQACP